MTNSKRETLVQALADQGAAEEQLIGSVSDSDRAATGTLERWSLRDNVAHIAHWRGDLAARLAERRAGGTVQEDDFAEDSVNAEVHAAWRDRPWSDVVDAWRSSLATMRDEVQQWDESALTADWTTDHPVYARVAGNSLWHPASHLATWLQENGRVKDGRALYEAAGLLATRVDGSERAAGTALYNVACFDALNGDRDAALANLAIAFEKRPELAGYATEDGDLKSLHDDPDFRALLPQH
jgi:hypothetical protein